MLSKKVRYIFQKSRPTNLKIGTLVGRWLGGLLVERRTSVSQLRGSIPGQALPCKNLGQVSHT